MQKKIIIKRIIGCIILLILLAFIIPIPIKREYDSIEIKLDDPNYLVNCQVKIYGRYHLNLLSKDRFIGKIVVSDYKLTNEKMRDVTFSDDGDSLYYTYTSGEDSISHKIRYHYCLGIIHSKRLFRQMVIAVFSDNPLNKADGGKIEGSWGNWTESDGYCIVPLVTNREEAINKLLKNKIIHSYP